jgi:hypothetical protein
MKPFACSNNFYGRLRAASRLKMNSLALGLDSPPRRLALPNYAGEGKA